MKERLINLAYNKKAEVTTPQLIAFAFFIFFGLIFLGTYLYGSSIASTYLRPAFVAIGMVGNYNSTANYDAGLGSAIQTQLDVADTSCLALILGMVCIMMLIAFKLSSTKRLLILLDIFVLILAFIISVYLSRSYSTYLSSLPSDIYDIYALDLRNTSTIVLNLPFLVPIVWFLMVVLTYAVPRKQIDPLTAERTEY